MMAQTLAEWVSRSLETEKHLIRPNFTLKKQEVQLEILLQKYMHIQEHLEQKVFQQEPRLQRLIMLMFRV